MRWFVDRSAPPPSASLWWRFVCDESGQDFVEYAYAAAFVGIVGYLALDAIVGTLGGTYSSWMSPATGVPSLWDPPAPAGS